MEGFDRAGLEQLRVRLGAFVDRGELPGLIALVARGDEVHVDVLGTPALDESVPLARDAIFRIASVSKPIAAAAAMVLVEEGALALDDPVETYLPELADRRVVRSLEGPLDDTVAAPPVRLRRVAGSLRHPPAAGPAGLCLALQHRGPGPRDFAGAGQRPGPRGLLAPAPPGAARDARHLLQRAAREAAPLHDRLCPAVGTGPLELFDLPSTGWWSAPPALANPAGMLVSTIDDLWSFVAMRRGGGLHDGRRLLSASAVQAMTTNHLTGAQRAANTIFLGQGGWGYGMATTAPLDGPAPLPWGYGWDGGTGTTWRTDPARGLCGILLTQRAMTSPEPPLFMEFWQAARTAMT